MRGSEISPFFALSGNGQDAKVARLMLEQTLTVPPHRVTHSSILLTAVLEYEHTLIRYAKYSDGLSTGRLRSDSSQENLMVSVTLKRWHLNNCAN